MSAPSLNVGVKTKQFIRQQASQRNMSMSGYVRAAVAAYAGQSPTTAGFPQQDAVKELARIALEADNSPDTVRLVLSILR